MQRGPDVKGGVRAPAIVTEFLSQGSLRGVLARKSDVISGPLVRVLIAMDAAKVRPRPALPCLLCLVHLGSCLPPQPPACLGFCLSGPGGNAAVKGPAARCGAGLGC